MSVVPGSKIRAYQIKGTDLGKMLDCIKADIQRNEVFAKNGYDCFDSVTAALDSTVYEVFDFDEEKIHVLQDGCEYTGFSMAEELVRVNFLESDEWKDGKACIEKLQELKDQIDSGVYG